MSTQVFPIAGRTFPMARSPQFNTRIATSVSGKEYRTALQVEPSYVHEFTFDYWSPTTEAALLGFFNGRLGAFDPFLLTVEDDNAIAAQAIGTGDGVATTFQLVRTLGGATQNIYAPNAVSAVKRAGTDHADWTVGAWESAAPGVVTFGAAPGLGQAITADFTYYWPVRFLDDSITFTRIMTAIYQGQGIKLKSLI